MFLKKSIVYGIIGAIFLIIAMFEFYKMNIRVGLVNLCPGIFNLYLSLLFKQHKNDSIQ